MRTREDSFETDLKALYEAIPFAEWCKWMKPPSSLNKKQKDLSPALDTASGNAQKEEDQHHVHAFSSARNLSTDQNDSVEEATRSKGHRY